MKGSLLMVLGVKVVEAVEKEESLEMREEIEVGRMAERPEADFDEDDEEEDSAPTRFPKTRRRLTPPSVDKGISWALKRNISNWNLPG